MVQKACFGIVTLIYLLLVGLCIWIIKKSDQLSFILKLILFGTCGVYTGLWVGYLYLFYIVRKGHHHDFIQWFYLGNSLICFLILILTGILLGVGWADLISADLVLWISFASSSVVTVRFPVFLLQKEFIKSLFGYKGQTELHNVLSSNRVNQPVGVDSSASLVTRPAVYALADVEVGTISTDNI
ncbi:hypothetical protein F5884DRAFT_779728 [Xylogone sp. PMI_703]|nr:hypothetical protein F5884DRAFT_779728 [Xylogone sp. PMI_703]